MTQPEERHSVDGRSEPAPDLPNNQLLVGVDAIAAYLSPPPEMGPAITREQVYRMKAEGFPIGKVPGLGLAIRPMQIDKYLTDCGA